MKIKNKKGFTLIELIGVIVILALLALLITPVVTSVINNSKEKLYQNTLKNIEISAKDWFSDEENIDKLPKNFETCYITLGELKDEGVVDLDIKNPETGELLDNNSINVIVTKNNNSYQFRAVDDGSYSGSPCSAITTNSLQPTISVTSETGFMKNYQVVISYDNLLNPAINLFQYYLSTSPDQPENGEWLTYENGVAQTIGTSLNGTYYIFVKRLVNVIDGENYYSTYGGVNISVDTTIYHRFGPYQFDNEKPVWTFYSKTNTNDFNENALQNLNYAYAGDTVTITFRGKDENFLTSNLSLSNIKILVGSSDVTDSVAKTLSNPRALPNGVEYTLALKNLSGKGDLSIVIDADTLEDKAGNKSNLTTISTGIKANICPYTTGKQYSYTAGQTEILYIPCDGTYRIEIAGGKGGGTNGGSGAKITADINLTRKTKLTISVGGSGGATAGGYNGGGAGGWAGGGGGGATDIRVGGTKLSDRILVAAGGGGGTVNSSGGTAGGTTGSESGTTSNVLCNISACLYNQEGITILDSSASSCHSSNTTGYVVNGKEYFTCMARYAQGGTQYSGGAFAIAVHFDSGQVGFWNGFAGTIGQGGQGTGGGGGGGGLYGGGGGGVSSDSPTGGAGGSSCVSGGSGYNCNKTNYQFYNITDTTKNSGTGYATITLIST